MAIKTHMIKNIRLSNRYHDNQLCFRHHNIKNVKYFTVYVSKVNGFNSFFTSLVWRRQQKAYIIYDLPQQHIIKHYITCFFLFCHKIYRILLYVAIIIITHRSYNDGMQATTVKWNNPTIKPWRIYAKNSFLYDRNSCYNNTPMSA